MDEVNFLVKALHGLGCPWNRQSLAELSGLQVPEIVIGRRRTLLRADINEQWAMWFVEGLSDPRQYFDKDISYPFLFRDIFEVVEKRFNSFTKPEKKEISATVARTLLQRIEIFRPKRQRVPISKVEKRLLIDLAGKPPRCWICGSVFAECAIDNFLRQERYQVPLPKFIDIFIPKGLIQRDMAIEIDHVVPHAHGGNNEGNLKLACGWCNRHKSDFMSIYDVEGRPRQARSNNLGVSSLPQNFWTIRLLAVGKYCEHQEGCSCSTEKNELTVAPICIGGAMNPTNIRLTCYDHDPVKSIRFQPALVVKRLWGIAE